VGLFRPGAAACTWKPTTARRAGKVIRDDGHQVDENPVEVHVETVVEVHVEVHVEGIVDAFVEIREKSKRRRSDAETAQGLSRRWTERWTAIQPKS
jgi:hypothetical protein